MLQLDDGKADLFAIAFCNAQRSLRSQESACQESVG